MKALTSEQIRPHRMSSWDDVHCSDLAIAMPWPKKGCNVGTMVRVADAVDACFMLPKNSPTVNVLRKGSGNTLGAKSLKRIHFTPDGEWEGTWDRIIGVEIAHDSIPIDELDMMTSGDRTLIVLGHEVKGIPDEAIALMDEVVEIPMLGIGNSLNVVNAGVLVAYKVRGLL